MKQAVTVTAFTARVCDRVTFARNAQGVHQPPQLRDPQEAQLRALQADLAPGHAGPSCDRGGRGRGEKLWGVLVDSDGE